MKPEDTIHNHLYSSFFVFDASHTHLTHLSIPTIFPHLYITFYFFYYSSLLFRFFAFSPEMLPYYCCIFFFLSFFSTNLLFLLIIDIVSIKNGKEFLRANSNCRVKIHATLLSYCWNCINCVDSTGKRSFQLVYKTQYYY